mmetsp:Transcript_1486/g.3410  ORF Transcript_1486/g.3410 Transcript_1486/m.3410 type:complete len:365 (-) Transcript_1486:1131-2225(-)
MLSFAYLKESAGTADGRDLSSTICMATIVDGIPAPGRVIGDGPIDGHETGRDALALPMEHGVIVAIIGSQLPFPSSCEIALIGGLPAPDRAEAAVSLEVVSRVRPPKRTSHRVTWPVWTGRHIHLDIAKLSSNGRIVQNHLLHLPLLRLVGQLRLDPWIALLPICQVLCHLYQDVCHGCMRVGAVSGEATLIALMLILLEGSDIASITTGHIVQHHGSALVHQSRFHQDRFDCLPGDFAGHGGEFSRDRRNNQLAHSHHLKAQDRREDCLTNLVGPQQDVFGCLAGSIFLAGQGDDLGQELKETVAGCHVLSELVDATGAIGGARSKGGAQGWPTGLHPSAIAGGVHPILREIHIAQHVRDTSA